MSTHGDGMSRGQYRNSTNWHAKVGLKNKTAIMGNMDLIAS